MYQYRIQQLLVFETEKSEFGGMIINPILLKILFFLIKEVYINMELRLLRYFLTVAKEQSFTKAAEQLHITQPTLSRQMAAFEEELGVTLFIRSGKKISLTEEGILLKRRALEILNLEEKTLEELKGKEDVVEGNITIGYQMLLRQEKHRRQSRKRQGRSCQKSGKIKPDKFRGVGVKSCVLFICFNSRQKMAKI